MDRPILKLGIAEFLGRSRGVPVIDVRAPAEFSQGHIPGAISMPLFNDDERAVVGTTYTKTGKEEALFKGLGIVGPKLKDFAEKGHDLATEGELLVHCWRGGMRSAAMAWLLGFSGLKVAVLEGGYKAYRHYTREAFLTGPLMIVLGGMTGSGKTDILKNLRENGEQVIDLEGLAHHKGSAFGSLGQPDQPTTEQFENELANEWLRLDPGKPVWVEDESRNIGKVIIPAPFFTNMAAAKLVLVDVPFETRVERLMTEYGDFDTTSLSFIIEKIKKRLGGDVAKSALNSLNEGDVKNAVSIVLKYYDKTYQYGLSKRDPGTIVLQGTSPVPL